MKQKINVKLIVSYDGTDYYGFQQQEGIKTVAGELFSAIQKITGESTEIICAGRTDKGVHAEGQVINFLTAQGKMQEYNWKRAINSILPKSIRITHAEFVPEKFSARFDAKAREYHYRIINTRFPDALQLRYAARCHFPLNAEKLNEYCRFLIGEYDFTSFCSSQDSSKTKIRRIFWLNAEKKQEIVTFRIVGSAFLHNMVRIIVGTILELYKKNISPSEIEKIREGKNRQLAKDTIEPCGLILKKVFYEEKEIPKLTLPNIIC